MDRPRQPTNAAQPALVFLDTADGIKPFVQASCLAGLVLIALAKNVKAVKGLAAGTHCAKA